MAQLQSTGITGSLQALAGGAVKFNVTSSGVTIGSAVTDVNRITGSLLTTGSSAIVGGINFSFFGSYQGVAWSIGGAMITSRGTLNGGAGTQNAGLGFGGRLGGPSYAAVSCTEEYDGSTWATGGAMITATFWGGGTGTQNEGLTMGGNSSNTSQEYNGTSWSSGGNLIIARAGNGGGAGTQNSAMTAGGYVPAPQWTSTEEYDGTSWSTGGTLITTICFRTSGGTQNEGLAVGGYGFTTGATYYRCTEEYNGTSWATGGALIAGRDQTGRSGTQNAGLVFGGRSAGAATEEYNGTSWASVSPMIVSRSGIAGAGTNTSALAGGSSRCTEEYGTTTLFGELRSFQYCDSNGVIVLPLVSSSLDFANDAAAATGGVAVGGLYRNGGLVQIRVT